MPATSPLRGCRATRRQPAETVNVQFLVAEFGTGSPYASVATTTVAFGAADLTKIATAPWTLGPTTSTHLCLGVQISTPADPFVAPGLNGNTPGWPTTDLMVINDNNKAQRNMSVHYGLSGFGSTHYAVLRNASKKARDFVLRLRADAKVLGAFSKPTIEVQGGGQAVPFDPQTTIVLKGMKAGESRWVAFGMGSFKAARGTTLPVDLPRGRGRQGHQRLPVCHHAGVDEPGAARAAALRRRGDAAPRPGVQARERCRSRQGGAQAREDEVDQAQRLPEVPGEDQGRDGKTVDGFLATKSHDRGLGILASWQALGDAMDAKDFGNAFANHTTLLNKLDVATTLARKRKKTKKT